MKRSLSSSCLLLAPSRDQPARHYFAGYLLNYRAALKLANTVSGTPIPPTKKDTYYYAFATPTEKSIREHLRRKGLESELHLQLVGEGSPFETMIVTQENFKFRGPLSKIVERGKEKAVREWLESKGNAGIPRSSLSYPTYRYFSGGVPVGG